MSHGVLALGVTVVCLAGNVWYLPACVDLRAGGDRPHSRRAGAAAVVAGWGCAALTALLLLTPVPLVAVAGVAASGATAVAGLAIGAWLLRGRERREVEACMAAFGHGRGPGPRRPRGPHREAHRRPAGKRAASDPAERER
ncbi:hypothetical protein ACIPJM_13860 [Streptomyces halstedii]|uniref:hypothetical protein n=1 Tax=Streptomyces halstedii TaxID=1944 RepID=UPI003810FCD9